MKTTTQSGSDIKSLAKTASASFPKLNAEEKQVALTLYRLLSEGEAVSSTMLAAALMLPRESIEAYLKAWPGIDFDDENKVIGFWGLSLDETQHHFQANGKRLYTWCAWDTLFIPQLLGKTAQVQSRCAVTKGAIRLRVSPEAISNLSPTDTVLSFITPDAAKVQDNVVQHFCRYVRFFASADSGRHWISEHPGTSLLSIAEAFRLGQLFNQSRYDGLIL